MNNLNIIAWIILCIGWLMQIIPFKASKARLIAQLIAYGVATLLFIINIIIKTKC